MPGNPRSMTFFKSTLSETDLIKGCVRNDRRTQELLYKQYINALLAISRAYVKNEEDAIEIVQDSFLKIFQNLKQYNSERSSLYTWMRTIVVRTAIDFLRKDKNAPQSIEWAEQHDPVIEADCLQHMTGQEILFLLNQLPQTTRTVFNLYITEGYNHREIGELLNISEGTSKWHLSEARKYLTNHLTRKASA